MDLAGRTRPDLALVNVALPEAQAGLALGRALQGRHVPVVYLTGHHDEDALAGIARVNPYGLVLLPAERYPLAVALEGALRRWTEELLARRCQDLSESERRFRAVFEQAGVGVSRINPERRFVETNERFARMVGRTSLELVGRAVDEITHPDDLETDRTGLARLLAGEDSVAWEKRYVRPDGSIVWCRVNVAMSVP